MKKLILGICTLAISLNVYAAEPSHRKAAEDLLIATNIKENIDKSIKMVEEVQVNQLKQFALGYQMDTRKIEKMMGKMMGMIKGVLDWENLKNDYIDVYTELFTEEEIIEMTEFYKKPIGAKLLKVTPDLMQKIMQISQDQMKDIQPQVNKIVQDIADELTKEIEKMLEAQQQ